MSDVALDPRPAPRRMKGAFDDDVYGKNLDVGQVRRLLRWMKPYRAQAIWGSSRISSEAGAAPATVSGKPAPKTTGF